MKTASIRQVQHHLIEVLALVEQGEEVNITRRNQVVATIVPPKQPAAKIKMPNFLERMKKAYPHKQISSRATKALLDELREERF